MADLLVPDSVKSEGDEAVGDVGEESPSGLDLDSGLVVCVEYVFGPGFDGDDENERNAFVDGFRDRGRYTTLDGFLSDFEATKVNDPDYFVLNEVSSFLTSVPEEEREVVFQSLKTALLARQLKA